MQEVASARSNTSPLFDAGPSSRLDRFTDNVPADRLASVVHTDDNEDAELLETALSLSLSRSNEEAADASHLLDSPHHSSAGSNIDTYSVIEPDSRPGSSFTSRSHSPLVVDISESTVAFSFLTTIAASQQDLTAASLEQMEAEQSHAFERGASPTPTVRSLTETIDHVPVSRRESIASPSYIASSRAPSQAASSRPISPFSELGFASAHAPDNDVDYVSRSSSAAHGGLESDKDSQWSDLGEDSSDEDVAETVVLHEREQQDLRERRQRFFAATAPVTD